MEKKYIFFDIDGTLINKEFKIPKSAKRALKMAQDKGHEIFISSGRGPIMLPDVLKDINFNGYVLHAGAYVIYNKELILDDCMPKEQVKSSLALLNKYGAYVLLATDRSYIATKDAYRGLNKDLYNIDPGDAFFSLTQEERRSKLPHFLTAVKGLCFLDNLDNIEEKEKIYHMDFFCKNRKPDLLQTEAPEGVNVNRSSYTIDQPYAGEMYPKRVTKSNGIKKLLEHIGAGKSSTIAFGDGPNDCDMMEFCNVSVAMGNAINEIKEISTYTTSHIDDDGIYKAMAHLGII